MVRNQVDLWFLISTARSSVAFSFILGVLRNGSALIGLCALAWKLSYVGLVIFGRVENQYKMNGTSACP